jgi:hypothetical protein
VEGLQIDHHRPHVLCSLLRSRWNRGSNLTCASSPLPVCTTDGKLSPSRSRISSVCSRVDIKLAYSTAGEARSTTGQPCNEGGLIGCSRRRALVLQNVCGRVYQLEAGMPRFALGSTSPEKLHKAAGFAGQCVSRNGCGSCCLLDARSLRTS